MVMVVAGERSTKREPNRGGQQPETAARQTHYWDEFTCLLLQLDSSQECFGKFKP
ncbi:hypothetical protein LEMLEM_LOCUS4202 [Lemmus lemmus]